MIQSVRQVRARRCDCRPTTSTTAVAASSRFQAPKTDGTAHQSGDARCPRFLHDWRPIAFDRSGANLEQVADRCAGVALDDKVEDLHLTRGQPVKTGSEILYRLLPLLLLEPTRESPVDGGDELVIVDVPESFGALTKPWPATTDDPSFFHLKDFGAKSQDYYGLSISEDSATGPVSISVARASGADMLVHSLLREFVIDMAWIIPLFVIVTLVIAVLVIRSGLRPVQQVSGMAAAIGPSTTSVRLPDESLPSEVTPLVAAVNRAFDRFAEGFAVQRQFTAHATHELRTPLAIITAALDAMEGGEELTKLRRDVARMNRLVEQLLRVARLDAIAFNVSETVDLNDVGANVVAAMAPGC